METFTAEFRQWSWWGSGVRGKIYSDTRGLFRDGEEAVSFGVGLKEEGDYYILFAPSGNLFKLPKAEEIKK